MTTPLPATPVAPARETASTVVASSHAAHIVACALAALIEIAAITLLAQGTIGPVLLVATHAAVIAALWVALDRARAGGGDISAWMITLLATAAIGPAGTIGSILVRGTARGTSGRAEARLAAWYDRIALSTEIDDVTRLCDRVSMGRTMDLSGAPPASFSAIMERGSLADRQTALGHIARRFHPHYLPALTLALKSPEPVIRVQAAAVATRVQAEIRACLERAAALAGCDDGCTPDCFAAIRDVETIVRSGLIDAADRQRATATIAALRTRVCSRLDGAGGTASLSAGRLSRSSSESVEQALIAERRFKDLRRLRMATRLRVRGGYRLRRLGRRAPGTAAATGTRSAS